MVEISSAPNGKPKPTIRVNAATVAAIASVFSLFVYIAGFISGYLLLRQNVTDLQGRVVEIQSDLSSVSTRLTHVEDDAHYTAQGVADLKALTAGTKR